MAKKRSSKKRASKSSSTEKVTPRPSVMAFARAIEKRLQKQGATQNLSKSREVRDDPSDISWEGWRIQVLESLVQHMERRIQRLRAAFDTGRWPKIAVQAIYVGAMAMMLWDVTAKGQKNRKDEG